MATISDRPLISTIYDRLLIEDDTEESVSGSDFHLAAILALYDVLLRFARRTARRWYVTAEVLVLVNVPDRARNPWRPMPDVYVVLDVDGVPRSSWDARQGAPFPHFICEVASEDTWGQDVTEKQRLYADLGALEYVVFDPTAEHLGRQLRAWHRLPDQTWAGWEPDAEGFLDSAVLGLRLRAEGTLLRVYDPQAGRLATASELEQTAHELEQTAHELEQAAHDLERVAQEQAAQLAQERAQRQALEGELARLRQDRPDRGPGPA